MICPYCFHTDKITDTILYPLCFYRHPIDMVQEDASGSTTNLYACPKCGKTFIIVY